jgi:uracil-DNA glycosylase
MITNRRVASQGTSDTSLDELLVAIRGCRACERHLPLGPRPILQAHGAARILIVGQAPGLRVHATGIPWNDPSGKRLRGWMAVTSETFYDASRVAIVPMGYCYPGRAASGDKNPRPECAALWLDRLLARLPGIALTLLIGQHAQRHYLASRRKPSLTDTVKAWREYSPRYFPLPHPSPRNQPWFASHPWFEEDVVPALRARVMTLVG